MLAEPPHHPSPSPSHSRRKKHERRAKLKREGGGREAKRGKKKHEKDKLTGAVFVFGLVTCIPVVNDVLRRKVARHLGDVIRNLDSVKEYKRREVLNQMSKKNDRRYLRGTHTGQKSAVVPDATSSCPNSDRYRPALQVFSQKKHLFILSQ